MMCGMVFSVKVFVCFLFAVTSTTIVVNYKTISVAVVINDVVLAFFLFY